MTQPRVRYRYRSPRFRACDTSLAPSLLEILSHSGIVLAYITVMIHRAGHGSGQLIVNLIGPLAMTGILAVAAWRLLRADGRNIWTALFWFRLSTGAYFGLGTCLVFVVNYATRSYIEAFYKFSDDEILKFNLIVSVSVVLVLGAARAVILLSGPAKRVRQTGNQAQGQTLLGVGVLFLVIGLSVNYGLKVPQEFGWTNSRISQAVLNLANFNQLGIFMLTLWSLERARWFLPIIIGIAAVEIVFQLLLFAKSGTLITLIVFLLAFLWRKITLIRAGVCAALVIGAYVVTTPLVGYSRAQLATVHGSFSQIGFGPRFEILTSYDPAAAHAFAGGKEIQYALLRISYVNAATLVIAQYDNGAPGDWPELLPTVFVPRALWPEKPIISDIGRDIYELGTGSRSSSSGAGVFAEAYWAMGWGGVIVYMTIYGVILGVLTNLAARSLREGKWLLLPVMLMALQIGFRTDGHYISDVAGASVIVAWMYLILSFGDRLLRLLSRPKYPAGLAIRSLRAPSKESRR